MNFLEAEQEFKQLEKRWSNGELDIDSYRALLNNLQVVNSSGQVWKMQEHTGNWFFLRDDQWIPAPQTQPLPVPQNAPVLENQGTPQKPRALKMGVLLLLVGLCVIIGGLLTAGILIYTEIIPLPENISITINPFSSTNKQQAEVTQAKVKPISSTTVNADGKPKTDSNGVTLLVPAEALEQGEQVNLSANELNASLDEGYQEKCVI